MYDSASIRFHVALSKLEFGRPAGNGVRGDASAWERLYPFFKRTNEQMAQPFTACGIPFVSDGIIKGASPSVKTLNGRGYMIDFWLNPNKPVATEMKLGRKFFNGNDAIDLSTGKKSYVDNVEWAVITNPFLTINVYEHRLPTGNVGLFCEAINLSVLLEAYEDNQFDHKVMFRKVSKRKTFSKKLKKEVIHEYVTLRFKPSAIKSWVGRRAQNATVRSILIDMGILTRPIYISSFNGVVDSLQISPKEFSFKLEQVY